MAFPTIEDYIGNTPLVRLQRLVGETSNTILVKLEGNNPAGSVKDRPALSMIQQAESQGIIKSGDTLIEATSGNTGIALAMAAAIKGYKMILYPTIKKIRLYNLKTDPLEQRDLAGDKSTLAIQKKLFARLLELQQDVGDKLDLESNFFGG